MAAPTLSVLIPALDEAQALPALLAQLDAQQGIHLEVLVADGGSRDGTPALARRAGATVLAAPRGRGAQLNAAAAAARASWLLCLHADSRLTAPRQLADALHQLRQAARGGAIVAGHWPLQFERCHAGHARLFRQLEAKSASNRPGTVNGDQGLMIARRTLEALGGFDASLPFFEDQRLAAQVFAQGRFELLPGVLCTSARRFEVEGHAPRLLLMALMVGAEAAGLQHWLSALPGLYRAQREAAALDATVFVEHLLAHITQLPAAEQRAVWRRAGALVAANGWQLALALDTRLGGSPRWLPFYDQRLGPLLRQPVAARMLAALLPLGLRATAALVRA